MVLAFLVFCVRESTGHQCVPQTYAIIRFLRFPINSRHVIFNRSTTFTFLVISNMVNDSNNSQQFFDVLKHIVLSNFIQYSIPGKIHKMLR